LARFARGLIAKMPLMKREAKSGALLMVVVINQYLLAILSILAKLSK
jgi:hypothetical protein